MGGPCSMQNGDDKEIQNFGQKVWREEINLETKA